MKSDRDLSRIARFLRQSDWEERFDNVLDDHVGPAEDEFDLDWGDFGSVLGEHWHLTLWGFALEDTLTRRFEPDDANLVEDYLKRRGWNETAQAKSYLRSLQTSVLSLYEVSDIVPGVSFRARDLLRGGEPILVSERTATRTIKTWDRLAARVVRHAGKAIITGGVLPYSLEAGELLEDELRTATGQDDRRRKLVLDDDSLRRFAHLFSIAWLFDVLPNALGERTPRLHNSEGDELLFHRIRFPITNAAATSAIAARLDGIGELRKETETFWHWVCHSPNTGNQQDRPKSGLLITTALDDGGVVLGTLQLGSSVLQLDVNSAARAERGIALLGGVLGDLVGQPLTEIQTSAQLRAANPQAGRSHSDIPPEQLRAIVHEFLDKQYRTTLDEPVGMLGGKTPRAAVRTRAGRQKVVTWLKYLENQTANTRDPADPMASYDFGWMWDELGVADLRS